MQNVRPSRTSAQKKRPHAMRKRIVRKPQIKKVTSTLADAPTTPKFPFVMSEYHATRLEDKITTIIVLTITVFFLLFVGYAVMRSGHTTGMDDADNARNASGLPFVSSNTPYPCARHDNDPESCVRVQAEGRGCSWYSDCRRCIVGSHDGKTYEEICGNKR